jgi:hypothetical protein
MKNISIRATIVPLALILLIPGCAERSTEDVSRDAFDAIARDAVSLYVTMHPLRSSRLGLEGADSLLFTFSSGEIERAMKEIDRLMAAVTSLPADDLDNSRVDESILLSDWMKGERFVFTQSRTCLDNPLLYCWMIEEALLGLPAGPWPPSDGERREWAARISRLPLLIDNASSLLEKPGVINLEETARRLEELSGRMPGLARMAGQRYGGPVPELEAAVSAIERYRNIIDGFLETGTHSRQIMGMEELSRILQYSEHLDFDQAKMIGDAEKIARRLARQVASPGVAVNASGGETVTASATLADSLLGGIEKSLSARRSFGIKKSPRSTVAEYEAVWEPMRLPVNPYLTLPVMPEREVRYAFGPGGCSPTVYVPSGREYTSDGLTYDLLLSSSLMSAPERKTCREDPRVRWIFGTETYRYAWAAYNSSDLTGLIPERRMQLNMIDTAGRVAALARMIIAFRLQSGTYTAEAAREYLAEIVPFGRSRMDAEVIRASVSPAAALEGIADMTVEEMVKKATVDREGGKPREKVRQLLLDSAGMPPYFLMMRMPF